MQDLDVFQGRVHHRLGVLHGIGVVDAVDPGRLEDGLGAYLQGAQGGGGIGGEIGVTGPRREDDYPPLLQVADGPPPDVGLGDGLHLDGRLYPREHALLLQGVLQGQGVHHRGQHAHVVRRRAVHTPGARGHAAEDIAAPHHDGYLHPEIVDGRELVGDDVHRFGVDAEIAAAHEGLTAQLDESSLETGPGFLVIRHCKSPFQPLGLVAVSP